MWFENSPMVAECIPVSCPFLRRMHKAWQYAGLDGDARIASYFMWTNPEQVSMLSGPALLASSKNDHDVEPLRETLSRLDERVPPLQRMLYIEGKHFLGDHNLNYMDKMSMANGVEVRVPFFWISILSMPLRGSLTRLSRGGVLENGYSEEVLKNELPREVLYRPKTGFGAPLRYSIGDELEHC